MQNPQPCRIYKYLYTLRLFHFMEASRRLRILKLSPLQTSYTSVSLTTLSIRTSFPATAANHWKWKNASSSRRNTFTHLDTFDLIFVHHDMHNKSTVPSTMSQQVFKASKTKAVVLGTTKSTLTMATKIPSSAACSTAQSPCDTKSLFKKAWLHLHDLHLRTLRDQLPCITLRTPV